VSTQVADMLHFTVYMRDCRARRIFWVLQGVPQRVPQGVLVMVTGDYRKHFLNTRHVHAGRSSVFCARQLRHVSHLIRPLLPRIRSSTGQYDRPWPLNAKGRLRWLTHRFFSTASNTSDNRTIGGRDSGEGTCKEAAVACLKVLTKPST
jgi:hypothetical protein